MIDKYVEVDIAHASPSTKPVSRKLKAIVNADQDRRLKINKVLSSWGAWVVDSGEGVYASRSTHSEFNDVDYDGHDNCLLSDHDSLMIEVNTIIEGLNPIDNCLIHHEYVTISPLRAKYWSDRYGKSQDRYRKRKSKLLLIISHKLRDKQ